MKTTNAILAAMCFYGAIAVGGSEVWMPWPQVVSALLLGGTWLLTKRRNE